MKKELKKKFVTTINKGAFGIDGYYAIMRPLTDVSHKPTEDEVTKYGLLKADGGDMSNYDIFDKKVRITIEVFD